MAYHIDQIIDYLNGSCKSLEEACISFDTTESDLTDEDRKELDDNIFECQTCNWWHENSEQSENGDCESCDIQTVCQCGNPKSDEDEMCMTCEIDSENEKSEDTQD